MLSDGGRVAHEPGPELLLPLLSPVRANRLAVGDLRTFFLIRDCRFNLDVEANHLLSSFVPHLLDAFPRSRFILLVRDLRQWIDSMINDQLNLRGWDGYRRWRVVYDQYLGLADRRFPPEERTLQELDLYPLSHYVRFWRDEVSFVRRAVPAHRLLVLAPDELAARATEIADLAGMPAASVAVARSHSYRSQHRHDVLSLLDRDYVERTLGEATGVRP